MQDPWVLPSLCELVEGHANVELDMSLSTVEVAYQAIQQALLQTLIKLAWINEDDQYMELIWAHNSSTYQDCLDTILF
jgi:hypothetical protein